MNTNQFYSFICFISQIADDASVIQLFPQVQIHMCPRVCGAGRFWCQLSDFCCLLYEDQWRFLTFYFL